MRIGRDWYAFIAGAVVPLCVYIASAYRDVTFWDIGEMDTVPWIAGIAHPTGFPAYIMLGWFWTHVLPIGSVAFRMSLLSSVMMSLTAGLIAWRIARSFDAPWVGVATAWLFAFGNITWVHATRAEVHAAVALPIAATIVLALEWYRTRRTLAFFAAAAAWGIGLATHPVALLILPGLVVFLIAGARDVRFRVLIGAAGLIAVIVLASYSYLPLRSLYVSAHAMDPMQALGVQGRPFWDYDHPATLDGFRRVVSGSDFDVRQALRSTVMPAIYLQVVREYFSVVTEEFTWTCVLLGLTGIVVGLVQDRWRAIGMLLCGSTCVPFALGYPAEGDISRYFLTSFIVAALFMGEAGAWLSNNHRLLRILVPVGLAVAALWLVWSQRVIFTAPQDERARRIIEVVQRYTPPNAIVLASWTYGTPLAYAAYVEQSLAGRTIDAVWLQDDARYVPRWMESRPVYVLQSSVGSVPGFRLQRVRAPMLLYKIVRQ